MVSVEEFKTSLKYQIDNVEDIDLLNRAYYVLTSPSLEIKAKDLFISRGLSTQSSDFSFFMNEVLPSTNLKLEDNLKLLDMMIDGDLITSNYLEVSNKTKSSLREHIDPLIPDKTLNIMFNHVADSLSSSSVGKGEFGFVLLTEGATKPKKGGDIRIGDKDIEIKARGAKLASQSSHVALMGIKPKVEQELGIEAKPLTNKNLEEYYLPYLGSVDKVLDLLKMSFSLTMYRSEPEFLDWISEVDTFDEFYEKIAVSEFTYYKNCDKFDEIVFLNPETLQFYTTNEMDETQLSNFKLTRSYSFASERIQTTNWELK